jgi:hypothetical protein
MSVELLIAVGLGALLGFAGAVVILAIARELIERLDD